MTELNIYPKQYIYLACLPGELIKNRISIVGYAILVNCSIDFHSNVLINCIHRIFLLILSYVPTFNVNNVPNKNHDNLS